MSKEFYLVHHGIKGQKWGVRRYQNKDGSLTAAGKKRQTNYESLSKEQRMKNAQRTGRKAIEAYQKIENDFSDKFNKAYLNDDWDAVDKMQKDYDDRFDREVRKLLTKSGYDYVYNGGGSNGLLYLQFGKQLSNVEYDKFGNEKWVDEFFVDNGDMTVYNDDED